MQQLPGVDGSTGRVFLRSMVEQLAERQHTQDARCGMKRPHPPKTDSNFALELMLRGFGVHVRQDLFAKMSTTGWCFVFRWGPFVVFQPLELNFRNNGEAGCGFPSSGSQNQDG